MRFSRIGAMSIAALFLAVLPSAALSLSRELLVPAAGRSGPWVTDLYVANPGTKPADVTVSWLASGQPNPDAESRSRTLAPGETWILPDAISSVFGKSDATGAFRVVASERVAVNSRIYATDGNGTKGQGFEGVPVEEATGAGQTAVIVGLTANGSFRTNFYALAGAQGARLRVELLDPAGGAHEWTDRDLGIYEPILLKVSDLLKCPPFDDGTLRVTVLEGTAVVGASKVDQATTDPTTLESATLVGEGAVDGTYQFALYDSSSFATGGKLAVAGGAVTSVAGTYMNWDKVAGGSPACRSIFFFGDSLPSTPIDQFGSGVAFTESYPGSGIMTYTLRLTFSPDGSGFTGSVDAVGSGFTATSAGCDGTFPRLTLAGGKGPLSR